jgi:flavin-dependent dehydrogenase
VASDIIILGGSLAGLSCAISLRQLGYDPLVLEKSQFPRKKLCGEFLGPDALAVLETLGVLAQIKVLAFGPVEQTFFYNRNGQSVKIRHAWIHQRFPYGLALPREILDSALVNYARSLGVTVLEGMRALSPVVNKNGVFQVRAAGFGEILETEDTVFQAPWLIDATGRNGKLAITSGQASNTSRPEPSKRAPRVGLQCHVRLPQNELGADLRMFLFAGGYGGLQPIGEDLVNLCMLVDAPLAKSLHAPFGEFIKATIGRNVAALEFLQHGEREGGFCTTADLNLTGEMNGEQVGGGDYRLLRIGDACVSVDPFTGSGMAHALETGQLAAQSLHQALQKGWDYAGMIRHYRAAYARRFKARLLWMRYCRPILENGRAQALVWPILPPFLPWLAQSLR